MNAGKSKRSLVWTIILFVLCLSVLTSGASQSQDQRTEPTDVDTRDNIGRPLRILYAGHPGSEREKDFVDFLGGYFGPIETADLKTFRQSQCDDFDVTLLDYDGDGFKAPRPHISSDFSRPIVTIGVPGALMCSGWRLKTGYL